MHSTLQKRWDPTSAVLLILIVFIASGRLSVTDWLPQMDVLQVISVVGGLLGIALGISRFRPYLATILATGYAITVVPLMAAISLTGDDPVGIKLMDVFDRVAYSILALTHKEFTNDWVFLLVLLGLVVWWVSVQAGQAYFRRDNLLAAVLPASILSVMIQVFDMRHTGQIWLLAFFFFLVLLLFARRFTLQKRSEWKSRRVFLLPETNQDWLRGIIIASALIILIAWGIPASLRKSSGAAEAWGNVTDTWDQFSERFKRNPSEEGVGDSQSADSYGAQMPLGTSIFQGGKVIFTVIPTTVEGRHPRYYWQARAYDRYEHGQWFTTPSDLLRLNPQQNLPVPDADKAQNFLFTLSTDQALFFHPGEPVNISQPASILVNRLPGGRLDVMVIQPQETLPTGSKYEIKAVTSDPSIRVLQAAGDNYPDWVKEHYLQLPDDFSPRLRALAADLTRQAKTPYEKAQAITEYLRKTITYSASIPEPPAGQDPLEWVLFNYKQGFCNYYATLDVLMLRSQGIPARLAVGYAQGDFDYVNQRYTVVRRDAHAWPEVYFPEIGWVEFEPTANQDELLRPVDVEGTPTAAGTPSAGIKPPITNDRPGSGEEPGTIIRARPFHMPGWVWWLAGLLVAGGLILIGRRLDLGNKFVLATAEMMERQQVVMPGWLAYRAYLARATPIERDFESINTALRWLEDTPVAGRTPAERAQALKRLLPQASESIDLLAAQLERALYSPLAGDEAAARQAGRNITTSALRAGTVKRLVKFINRHTFYKARRK
jgi:hypothetical protein